jgi:cbb3-type cytochrome oxidase subunit 3
MKKVYAVINLVVTLLMIAANYYTNVAGINGNTVGSLSGEYTNYFTPAGYAFSIWGIIFIALLFHAYYQIRKAFFDDAKAGFLEDLGPWLIIANLGNMAWLFAWLYEYTGLSVLIMAVILFSLIKAMLNLNMERWDAPFKIIRWIWWPIVIYAGWITVATVANISAYLAKIGWLALFSEQTWAVIMIVVAAAINLFVLVTRSAREFVVVGIWAIWAIAQRFWETETVIRWTAIVCCAVLFMAISIHAYIYRSTLPFMRTTEPEA